MNPPANRPDGEMPLSPAAFHILLSLVNQERHGYGIMQEVYGRTGGRMRIVPGTLYGAIRRLLAKSIIEECGERPDLALNDERRRYYRLTDYGLQVITAEAVRLAQLVRQAEDKQLLGAFGLPQLSGIR